MSLREKIREIEEKGLKALNPSKTSYLELNALGNFLNLNYAFYNDMHYLLRGYTEKIAFKSKKMQDLKDYLIPLLMKKLEKKEKEKRLKMDLERLRGIEREKLEKEIINYNKGGLFKGEELAS